LDQAIHVTTANTDDRSAAGLRLERYEAKGFLDAG
jgi:hypothetical protein